MREGAVGFCHLVRIFTFLYSVATIVRGIQQLSRKAINHSRLTAFPRAFNNPAYSKRLGAFSSNLNRNLIGGTTNTA